MADDVQGMDDTGNITKDCEEDVDEQISGTTTLEENTDGWQDHGDYKKELAYSPFGNKQTEQFAGEVEW